MRKLLFLSLFLLFIYTTGCETDRIVFEGPYHIRFTEASGFAKESVTDVIEIEVHNVGPARDEDTNISYSIGGSARENIDYVFVENRKKLVIPAGEYVAYIKIQLINNANNILRSQNIVLTLQSANTNDLEVGQGISQIGNTYTFTIFDDCILGGIYTGELTSDRVYQNISVTGSAASECVDYLLSNWNIDAIPGAGVMDLTFKDNGDNTLTIPPQEEEALVDSLATISGNGVVNPTTGDILFTVILDDLPVDDPEYKNKFTLKRQQ